jgi:enoyl-CoA hydratase/carnithine racemase
MITLLAAHVGPARMKEMILTCRHYTANDLLSMGMLNQIVTQAKLLPTVSDLAQSLAKKNSNAVMVSKATANAVFLNQAVLRPDLLLTRG